MAEPSQLGMLKRLLGRPAEPTSRISNKSSCCKPVGCQGATNNCALPMKKEGKPIIGNLGQLLFGRQCQRKIKKTISFPQVFPGHQTSSMITLVSRKAFEDTLEIRK